MPLMKLQTDIDYELIQKLEEHKAKTKKSKAAIVSEALREYFERQEDPEPPRPHIAPVPELHTPVFPPYQPGLMNATYTTSAGQRHPAVFDSETDTLHIGQTAPADLFPEDPEDKAESTPGLKNVEPVVLTPEQTLRRLKERLAASKSGQEIDDLTRQINQIESAQTVALLNALPGADPAYVASREANET